MRSQSAQRLLQRAFASLMRDREADHALIHDDAGGHRFGAAQHARCARSARVQGEKALKTRAHRTGLELAFETATGNDVGTEHRIT
jgi:hypothetical protein